MNPTGAVLPQKILPNRSDYDNIFFATGCQKNKAESAYNGGLMTAVEQALSTAAGTAEP
jgi:hypothetical protein